MVTQTAWVNIDKAVLEMAYDNGCVNRERTEAALLNELDRFLSKKDSAQLRRFDDWLETLDDDQIQLLVAGEESEVSAFLADQPDVELAQTFHNMLDDIFDEVL